MQFRVLGLVLCLFIASNTFGKEKYAPLPSKLMQAKSVYIENKTGDAERGDVFFKELTKWKRFSIVSEKSKADLVFVLGMTTHEAVASNNVRVTNKISDNTRMTTVDAHYSYEYDNESSDTVDAID